MQSCKALTNMTFFILSFVTPCASHTTLITNQNWSGSSFPTPLNTRNFILLAIFIHSGGGGGTSEDGGEGSEIGGGVGGGDMRGILCLIKLITLHEETFASSSSSPRRGEIKGLFSGPLLPSFLSVFPLRVAPNIKVIA